MKFGSRRRPSALAATMLLLATLLSFSPANDCRAADAIARRKVIIDQDAFGPAGSNLQAILMLLQAKDVEVLGITIPSGDGWRDEEVSHTLRLLEIAHRTEVPVCPGAVFPLVNTQNRTKRWRALRQAVLQRRLDGGVAQRGRRCAVPPITPTRTWCRPPRPVSPRSNPRAKAPRAFCHARCTSFPAR